MSEGYNTDFIIEKAKACAFTGHRNLLIDFEIKKVEEEILKLINIGYRYFLVGMALGFDTVCFNLLEKLRKKHHIKIIACIPCLTQDKCYNLDQKREYDRMINTCDQKIIISQKYNRYCMHKRNRFMVDNCSCLIAYLRQQSGGTASTVKYALDKGVKIINI